MSNFRSKVSNTETANHRKRPETLAGAEGLEPPTLGFGGVCHPLILLKKPFQRVSNRLSNIKGLAAKCLTIGLVIALAGCSSVGQQSFADKPGVGNGYWMVDPNGKVVWKVYHSSPPGRVLMQDRTFHSICGKMCRPHLGG